MIGPAARDWPAETTAWCQRCDRAIRYGQPYAPMIPFLGSWGGFMHQYCPPRLVALVQTPAPVPEAGCADPVAGHIASIERYDVLPRGWSEAWVWTCSCGASSWSIMRTPGYARRDHLDEHATPAHRAQL